MLNIILTNYLKIFKKFCSTPGLRVPRCPKANSILSNTYPFICAHRRPTTEVPPWSCPANEFEGLWTQHLFLKMSIAIQWLLLLCLLQGHSLPPRNWIVIHKLRLCLSLRPALLSFQHLGRLSLSQAQKNAHTLD